MSKLLARLAGGLWRLFAGQCPLCGASFMPGCPCCMDGQVRSRRALWANYWFLVRLAAVVDRKDGVFTRRSR